MIAALLATAALQAPTGDGASPYPPGGPGACAGPRTPVAEQPVAAVRPRRGPARLQTCPAPCPAEGPCPWGGTEALHGGMQVLTTPAVNGWRRVTAALHGRVVTGFVPADAVAVEMLGPVGVPADFLVGRWTDGDDRIDIRRARTGGGLAAHGDGVWPARGFPGPPGPHFGGFDGPLAQTDAGFTVVDGGCQVRAVRRGPYLLFDDNARCGALNVRFRGVYARVSR